MLPAQDGEADEFVFESDRNQEVASPSANNPQDLEDEIAEELTKEEAVPSELDRAFELAADQDPEQSNNLKEFDQANDEELHDEILQQEEVEETKVAAEELATKKAKK